MAQQIVNIGSTPNARDGDPLRTAFTKLNNNFTEVYGPLNNTGLLTSGQITASINSIDSVLLIDHISGKLTNEAIPNIVTTGYEFRVNFDFDGNPTSLANLPANWIGNIDVGTVTITHDIINKHPKIIQFWGLSNNQYTCSFPGMNFWVSSYRVSRPATGEPQFTLSITADIANSANGSHAIVSVVF